MKKAMAITACALALVVAGPAHAETIKVLGETITFKVDGDAAKGKPSVVEVVTPPGMGPPLHQHSREDETFYVLSGQFRIWHGEAVHDVKAGDAIYMERDVPHTYKNVGKKPGKLLVTITPSGFEGFFREIARQNLGPNDGEKLTALGKVYGLEFLGPPK
jgi:quercetin dioxygenase-like cupin family protein